MNSFNHYSFGSVGEWMYRYVAGIDTDADAPGYGKLIIRPRPGGGLTWAKASYASIHGRIASEWHRDSGRFDLTIEIPANTTATVYVPSMPTTAVEESDRPATTAEGVKALRRDADAAVFVVSSGTYHFRSTID
jgi:alpha-L-rhamnosidase